MAKITKQKIVRVTKSLVINAIIIAEGGFASARASSPVPVIHKKTHTTF